MRRVSKQIRVGNVLIGGNAPISVQSMTTSPTADIEAVATEILQLKSAGCDIVRVAVTDSDSAAAIPAIKQRLNGCVPIVADIQFNYKFAVAAIKNGADKIRINPGNIGTPDNVREIAAAAADYGVPIRVGVNSGSIEAGLLEKCSGNIPEALAQSALANTRLLEGFSFTDICISAKSSSPIETLETYRLLAEKTDYPLHIGVTEAGTEFKGAVRSAAIIGTLLSEGIGDTIRVSLTGGSASEAEAGTEILRSLGLRPEGSRVISCPTCARTAWNLVPVAIEIEAWLKSVEHKLSKPITVAVMGCAVNGPGESKHADFGIAGGKKEGLIFRHGEIVEKVSEERLAERLKELILPK